jgi:hypothetical protein
MAIFTGTSGADTQDGTGNNDDFHYEQGGADTLNGRGGADVFFFGTEFREDDLVDGGLGHDILLLEGDYSPASPSQTRRSGGWKRSIWLQDMAMR